MDESRSLYVDIITEPLAQSFLKELGIPYRYSLGNIYTRIERSDAPTLLGMIKDAGFLARFV